MGFESDVRDYLKKRSGEHPVIPQTSRRSKF
jgi:hypothetical protein